MLLKKNSSVSTRYKRLCGYFFDKLFNISMIELLKTNTYFFFTYVIYSSIEHMLTYVKSSSVFIIVYEET